jgi:hypothetical protein
MEYILLQGSFSSKAKKAKMAPKLQRKKAPYPQEIHVGLLGSEECFSEFSNDNQSSTEWGQ